MKGLILKDLFGMKQYTKILLLLLAVYGIVSVAIQDIGFLSSIIPFLFIILSITSFSYDEVAKWNRYALSLPVSRGQLVAAKYVLALLLCAAGFLCSVLFGLVSGMFLDKMPLNELLLSAYCVVGVGLVLLSVMLPCLYKFGVEKGRMILMITVLLPTLLVMLMKNVNIQLPSEEQFLSLLPVTPFALALLFYLSFLLSSYFFKKKDI